MKELDNIYGWHFLHEGHKLRDGSVAPEDGQWMTVANPKMCRRGLHGSRTPGQALQYAPGPILCLCEFSAPVDEHLNDKFVSASRRIIARLDATEMLSFYARMQALSVVHLWDAPDVVLDYLMTGDESSRAATWNAVRDARNAAWDAVRAVRNAAWDATWNATWNATRDDAKDDARNATWAATWNAAWAAAWAAARAVARDVTWVEFDSLAYECFEGQLAEIGWKP